MNGATSVAKDGSDTAARPAVRKTQVERPEYPAAVAVQMGPRERQLMLSGEIDLARAPEIRSAGERIVDSLSAGDSLVVDMGAVVFIDSTGLGALVSLRNSATRAGAKLILRRTPPQVLRVIELSGLKDSFELS
jgi:anti-sigma B factor antagonist